MHLLDFIRIHLLALPLLARGAMFLVVIAAIPPLCRRLKLPSAVGFVLAGLVIGPHGLEIIGQHRPIADFFAEMGKLLLMFSAGLEVDLVLFRKVKNRAISFGILTTFVPLLLGTGAAAVFGYSFIPAVVIGSLLASHTLLGLPTLLRLGEARMEPVTITMGATVMSDTLSLVVFAICVSTFRTGFSWSSLWIQLLEIAIFVPFILVVLGRLGQGLLKKMGDDEDAFFIMMIAIVVIAAIVADQINLPGIVGAFLAGLAVNSASQNKPAKEKLEFFGNALFVPIFFVVTGFLIEPRTLLATITGHFAFVLAIILSLLIGKAIASELTGRKYGYSPEARKTVWSLTLPQVAATLAAALVGYDTLNHAGERLLDDKMLNVVLVLMLTTAIGGPILTERFAPKMLPKSSPSPA